MPLIKLDVKESACVPKINSEIENSNTEAAATHVIFYSRLQCIFKKFAGLQNDNTTEDGNADFVSFKKIHFI